MAASGPEDSKKQLEAIIEQVRNRRSVEKLGDFSAVQEVLSSNVEFQRLVLLDAIRTLKDRTVRAGNTYSSLSELANRFLRRKLPLIENDICEALSLAYYDDSILSASLSAAERFVNEHGISQAVTAAAAPLRDVLSRGWRSNRDQQKLLLRINAVLGESVDLQINVDADEPWVLTLLDDLALLSNDQRAAMSKLITHLATASGGKPTGKWLKMAAELTHNIDKDLLRSRLENWIAAFHMPRTEASPRHYSDSLWYVDEANADLMKGLIWASATSADASLIRIIGTAGLSGQKKVPELGPRSTKVTNAAIWALSQIDSQVAIGQLAILRSKITNKSVQKQIDKAIDAVAERLQVPADEIEEMAVPAYGLTEVGKRTKQLGDFTAELVVTGATSTQIRWIKPDGKTQKTVPKAVKDHFADDLKELKAAAKDIQKMLPAQRDRIDLLHLKQKTWSYATLRERYLDHPLVGTLARRLIWTFDSGKPVDATWLDGQFIDVAGDAVEIADDATVSLWHPIGHDESTITAWRRFFEDREIKQPFKQAHREVYLLTDAERNTKVYSNRYASHIIKQHQYNALCGVRGWKNQLRLCVDADYPPTYVELPEWNLRAEFWVEGVGDDYGVDTNESGVYLYLSTDQVRFYAIDADQVSAHAGGGGYAWGQWRGETEPEPLPLNQIPPLVFSEIMRDVDLFVGVASVANDPNWEDGGPEGRYRDYWHDTSFGELGATAKTRREILERLVPKLKIAERCSFDEKFLIVRGDKRTYKIHLGSSNILMEPNDQYLCIVPGRGAGPGDKVFLPFEGDQRLAVILSKAMMLAADKKITDPTILSQIGR